MVAIDAYEALFDDPAVGHEARLRAAYLRLRLGDPVAALAAFAEIAAAGGPADPFVPYLGHFFAGRAHERLGALADAETAYRRALDVLPGAQSAAVALSARLFQDGRVDEAYGVMERALAVSPQPDDPWRTYGYGDLRFWPALVARLRAQVTR